MTAPARLTPDSPLPGPQIDALLDSLSLDACIGQMIHVAGWSNRGPEHRDQLLRLVEMGIGGIIFFQGDPLSQLTLSNELQQAAALPLLLSMDAEWGLAMRLQGTLALPYAATLGAVHDLGLLRRLGAELARQCLRIGVHMNFAPVADVNLEPRNPVIGFRSFGSYPEAVAEKAAAMMLGMQEAGLLAVAKHFPGHGDTDRDSHLTMPLLPHSRERLDAVELLPFRRLIAEGVAAVMPSHLHVPAWEPEPGRPATLSKRILQGLLRESLGFEGLIITDAMDMKGVADYFAPGLADREAVLAGNDIILFPVSPEAALREIRSAVREGLISEAEIRQRCRRILLAKLRLGLWNRPLPSPEGLAEDLHPASARAAVREAAFAALTDLKPGPPPPEGARLATVALHAGPPAAGFQADHHDLTRAEGRAAPAELSPFQQAVAARRSADAFFLRPGMSLQPLLEQLRGYDAIAVSIHGLAIKALNQFGIGPELSASVEALGQLPGAALILPGSPYALRYLAGWERFTRVLTTYQESPDSLEAAACAWLGEAEAPGKLPLRL
jgi:beta-glucosidase-like glycosyl hydrolase